MLNFNGQTAVGTTHHLLVGHEAATIGHQEFLPNALIHPDLVDKPLHWTDLDIFFCNERGLPRRYTNPNLKERIAVLAV